MIVSIDTGYGYTKAVSETGRVMFPSVISPAAEQIDLGIETRSVGHTVTLRPPSSTVKQTFFIGELALKNSRGASITLARDKFARDSSLILTFTAAYLTGAEGRVALAFGTPIAYYKHQKDEVLKALSGISAYVSVNGGTEKFISFDQVFVLPQGVGALMSAGDLPLQGLVGLIDIGYYTTDYVLVELKNGGVEVYPSYVSSVELGVSTAMREFASRFTEKTGYPLRLLDVQTMWDREKVNLYGKPVELAPFKTAALETVATSIADAVDAAWKEKIALLDVLYVAGGGGIEFFQHLKERLRPDIKLLREAQYANALGFLKIARARSAGKQESGEQAENAGFFR